MPPLLPRPALRLAGGRRWSSVPAASPRCTPGRRSRPCAGPAWPTAAARTPTPPSTARSPRRRSCWTASDLMADPPADLEIRPLWPGDDLDAQLDLSERAFGPGSAADRDRRVLSLSRLIAGGRYLGAFVGGRPAAG